MIDAQNKGDFLSSRGNIYGFCSQWTFNIYGPKSKADKEFIQYLKSFQNYAKYNMKPSIALVC